MRGKEGDPRAQRRVRVPRWVVALAVLAVALGILYVIFGLSIVQASIQGLVVGSIYVLGASGLSLTYGVKKFANFAHGDLMTVGAYIALLVTTDAGLSIVVGFLVAAIGVALLGMFLELAIFRRLEGRGEVAPLIASVGVALVIENVLNLFFGGGLQYLPISIPQDFSLGSTGLHLNAVKGIATGLIAVGLMVFLHVLLKRTTLGKAMRACSDDLDLARASGINTRNIILWTWALSGAFAAVAGILLAVLVNVFPLLGFNVLLFIFAAVIIGGIGSPSGALIGGFLVGLIQVVSDVPLNALAQAGILRGGVAYEPAAAFLVMIVVLLILPDGIMGTRKTRNFLRYWKLRIQLWIGLWRTPEGE